MLHVSVGTWVGLELPSPTGRNDGSVQGKRFFTCEPNYGLFIKSVGCEKIDDSPNEVGGSQSDGGEGCSADAEPSTFGGLRENSVTVKLLRLKDQEAKKRAESKQRPSAAPVRRAAVEGIVRRGDTVGAETAQRWHAESPAVAQMQTALDSLAAHVALEARTQQLEGVVVSKPCDAGAVLSLQLATNYPGNDRCACSVDQNRKWHRLCGGKHCEAAHW